MNCCRLGDHARLKVLSTFDQRLLEWSEMHCTVCEEDRTQGVTGPELEVTGFDPVETFICQVCVDYCIAGFGFQRSKSDSTARMAMRQSLWKRTLPASHAGLPLTPLENGEKLECSFCQESPRQDTKLIHVCDFFTYKKDGRLVLERVAHPQLFLTGFANAEPCRVVSVNLCDRCIALADSR